VIVPVKDPDPARLRRCLAAFCSLSAAPSLQLLLMHTGPLDSSIAAGFSGFHSIHAIACEEPGIYSACNEGIGKADGRFLLFFGHDDIALPEMDKVIARLGRITTERVLVACGVCIEGLGVRSPSRLRQSILFRNWGHQGLFYSADILRGRAYESRYAVRADHRLNIALLADPDIECVRMPEVVCYFPRGGFSTLHPVDAAFERDRYAIARQDFGVAWGAALWALMLVMRALRLLRGQLRVAS
jgi:hypothetical protein